MNLNYLKENQGKLMLMKGFLSINCHSLSALRFPTKSIQQADLIDVLFEIECNVKELGDNLIFADLTQFSEESISKTEVLFDLNTTFRLENIQQVEQIWIIRIIAVNDGQIITQKYIDDTHRQIENLSTSNYFW